MILELDFAQLMRGREGPEFEQLQSKFSLFCSWLQQDAVRKLLQKQKENSVSQIAKQVNTMNCKTIFPKLQPKTSTYLNDANYFTFPVIVAIK